MSISKAQREALNRIFRHRVAHAKNPWGFSRGVATTAFHKAALEALRKKGLVRVVNWGCDIAILSENGLKAIADDALTTIDTEIETAVENRASPYPAIRRDAELALALLGSLRVEVLALIKQ